MGDAVLKASYILTESIFWTTLEVSAIIDIPFILQKWKQKQSVTGRTNSMLWWLNVTGTIKQGKGPGNARGRGGAWCHFKSRAKESSPRWHLSSDLTEVREEKHFRLGRQNIKALNQDCAWCFRKREEARGAEWGEWGGKSRDEALS